MVPQEYKVINAHNDQLSACIILYGLLNLRSPHIVLINGDVKYNLDLLDFKQGEQLE